MRYVVYNRDYMVTGVLEHAGPWPKIGRNHFRITFNGTPKFQESKSGTFDQLSLENLI